MDSDPGTQAGPRRRRPAASRSPCARSGRSRSSSGCSGFSMPLCSSSPSCSVGASSRTIILANATGQPFVLGDFITHIGNFVSPDIAVWNTFFALIQLFIGVGLLFRRTVRPALAVSFLWVLGVWVSARAWACSSPARRRPSPVPRARCSCTGCSVSWPGPGRHGAGSAGATVPPASPRRPPPRASGARSRRWPCGPATGRCPPSCSCFLPTAPRTSTQSAIAGMADEHARLVRPLPRRRREPVLDERGPRRPGSWPPSRSSSGLGPLRGAAARLVPRRRRAPFLLDVDCRPGSRRRRLHWLGYGPEHRAARDPAGGGHGAYRHCVEGGLALARRRGPAAESGGGPPRHRRPRGRAGPQRQLSRAGDDRVVEQRHERHGHGREQHVGSGSSSQSATVSTCVPHQTGLKISGLDLANTPIHDHERQQRHGHERRRRQRGGRLQHDDAQLALHRTRPRPGRGEHPAGGWQQRAERHPHGGERLRAEPDGGRRDRRPAVRAGDQRAVSATPRRRRPWRPGTFPRRRPTTRS